MRDLRNYDSCFIDHLQYVKDEANNRLLSFMYQRSLGIYLQKMLTQKVISRMMGAFYDSRFSKIFIPSFILKHDIDMSEYVKKEYSSFNDFFTRQKKDVPFSSKSFNFCAPCDGFLSAFFIDDDCEVMVKGLKYTIEELLKSKALAKKYKGGYIYIFRLMPHHYHRYHFFDDGFFLSRKRIEGIFHTVRPVALQKKKVFIENTREYSLLETKNFGDVLYMEVGALGVGKIMNHEIHHFSRGQEKGMFMFGGSTVIVIFEKDILKENKKLLKNSLDGFEAVVQCGCIVGEKNE